MRGAHAEIDFSTVLPGCILNAVETPGSIGRSVMQLLESMEAMTNPKTGAAPISIEDFDAAKALTRDSLLAWLRICSEDDVAWFLTQASKERPSAYGKVARATLLQAPTGDPDSPEPDEVGRGRVHRSLSNAHARTGPPLVQFSAFMYFCTESDGDVRLDVMRMGNLSEVSEVHYRTVDGTAKAGSKYCETQGTLVFEAGVNELDVSIPLISDRHWDTTTEFKVCLSDPNDCLLGSYLHSTRVKIMDEDTFPSNKYRKQILHARDRDTDCHMDTGRQEPDPRTNRELLELIPKWGLLLDYFRLNFADPIVKRGTIKAMIIDQLHNLRFILNLMLSIILVDVVFKEFKGNAAEGTVHLIVIAVLMIVPFACLHVLDYLRLTFKIGGGSRIMLQRALIRKFLNYSEESRVDIKHGDLVMAITRDTHGLVHDGYARGIGQVKALGRFLYIVAFQVAVQVWRGSFAWEGFAIIGIFPVVLLAFLRARRARSTSSVTKMNNLQDELVGQVDRVITNFRIIADYSRRPYFVKKLEGRCREYNASVVFADMVHTNNQYAAKWLTNIFLALYTLWGGIRHLENPEDNTLGMFLANVTIIKTLGGIFGTLYFNVTEMEAVFPALLNIVMLLNLPVDLHQRMKLNRYRRQETSERRLLLKGEQLGGFALDYLPIEVDLSRLSVVGRRSMHPGTGVPEPAGTMAMMQGSFVALVGPRGQGKTTLLKTLGGVILPEHPGCFFMPSHLRMLHVATDPIFFMGTLYENLTFGAPLGGQDRKMDRVLAICKRLGLSEKALRWVQQGERETNPDAEVRPWGELLSHTEKCLCQLARAFIANPEVLCVHKPTMPFNNSTSMNLLLLLREFCAKKGLEHDAAAHHLRRPRTCIITSSKVFGMEITDQVFMVDFSDSPSVREVDRSHVTDVMLT